MFKLNRFDSKTAILASAVLVLAGLSACNKDTSATQTTTSATAAGSYEIEGDHAIGNPKAEVTIVEYASVGCGHCATFHETTYPELKAKYIDTGKVRFVFREFGAGNPTMTKTGFLMANCVAEDQYFNNISLQFKRFEAIQRSSDPKAEYFAMAKSSGLSKEDFIACVTNEDGIEDLKRRFKVGTDAGVDSTPTFFFNGEKIIKTESGKPVFNMEAFDEVLEPMLGMTPTTTSEEAAAE